MAQSKLWPRGTLCITIAANIAKTGILAFDACFPDSVVGLVSGEHLVVEYIRFWFVTMEKLIDAAATQVAQKNINLEILDNLTIAIPPRELQASFACRVRRIYEVKRRRTAAKYKCNRMFDCLIQRAFRGQL